MFVGRESDLDQLQAFHQKKKSQIAVLYGRRRVGKSALLKHFCQGKNHLYFEGLEGEQTQRQIQHFTEQLRQQTKDSFLEQALIKSWQGVFTYLTNQVIKNEKLVIVFDELQWMAAKQNRLVALIKYFWDNHWKDKNVFLMMCGSISSFMINKVIKSKALYGRIDLELHVTALLPHEIRQLLPRRSLEEVLRYLMLFGGVPKYFEEISTSQSFDRNINSLCFTKNGFMTSEFEKIFYGQFPEADSYLKIVRALSAGPKTLDEISQATKIASGGGLKQYVVNLKDADFVGEHSCFGKAAGTHLRKYKLIDEYLCFYFKYILPLKNSIDRKTNKFIFQKMVKTQWLPWLGLAFERFCVKRAVALAHVMGFGDELKDFAPFFGKDANGVQIDLVYQRLDNVIVLCEIKFSENEIDTKIIPEFQKKMNAFKKPRGFAIEKVLISLYGPSPALRDTEYFDYFVTMEDFFKE